MRGAVIEHIETGDVTPDRAPHRISNKATKNRLVLRFTTGDLPTFPSDSLFPSDGLFPSVGGGLHPSDALFPSDGLFPSSLSRAPEVVRAVRINLGGDRPHAGVLVGQFGCVCEAELPCEEALACTDWEGLEGETLDEDVTWLEAHLPDGDVVAHIWTLIEGAWH